MNPLLKQLGIEVEEAARIHRSEASIAAAKAKAIDRARVTIESMTTGPVTVPQAEHAWANERLLVTELACAFRVPERTMETMIAVSKALVHELPATLAVLEAGEISYRHATTLFDQTIGLSPENTAALEAAVLPDAGRMTVAKFAQQTRRVRERLDAESITARHERSVADRAVFFEPAQDGMCWVNAFLPAARGQAIVNRITRFAMSLQGSDEPRTLTQLKADVLIDLVLDTDSSGSDDSDSDDDDDDSDSDSESDGGSADTGARAGGTGRGKGKRGIKVAVVLLVPALTLLGRSDEPAVLEGYGPIDLDTAKELVGNATSFLRILTHPETGAFLSVGRERYRPPADLRTVLQLRDGTCRFPGCNRAARQSDLDHTIPFAENGQQGETRLTNMACLCAKNHRDKHEIGWQVSQNDDGILHWTSPTGLKYDTDPENEIGLGTLPVSNVGTTSTRPAEVNTNKANASELDESIPPF